VTAPFAFDNSYAQLPPRFFAKLPPTGVAAPRLIQFNRALAIDLGLDVALLDGPEGVEILAGNRLPEGAEPLAAAYAGHQFGQFNPQLGDGRAILLGEVIDRHGVRRDIQLKGAGPTPFSRMGDGRAALGPVLREYLVSEAMAVLGIPTTRALAALSTGQPVYRETALPGAILVRTAASHLRIGSLQFFAARGDVDALALLVDYSLKRHYPEDSGAMIPALALLRRVMARQAELVASWLLIGFIHGVMNTDNMSIAGETIDYGPCAFMDSYDPATVYSAIDHGGRYAYGNQPRIAQWNLTRLAEALLPLLDPVEEAAVTLAQETLAEFPARFEAAYSAGLRRKLGLVGAAPGDLALGQDLLALMAEHQADFTLTFRALNAAAAGDDSDLRRQLPADALDSWLEAWRQRLAADDAEGAQQAARLAMMRLANPAIIPRNHLIAEVIAAAVERDDFAPFAALQAALAQPFDAPSAGEIFALPPRPEQQVHQTFCGT
jgi:uncharacterized protein YdiU (UPF0061 family)